MKRVIQNFRTLALALGLGFSSTALAGDEHRSNRGDEGAGANRGKEEFRTNRGKVYQDCSVVSRDAYGILIRHRGGAARLAFSDLSPAVQKRYNYDKAAAQKFVKRHTPVVPVRSSQIAHQRAIATHLKDADANLNKRRRNERFDGGRHPNYASDRPRYNPNSYLQNQVRYGNHIAPAMNGGHIRATNGGNPVAPAMMSYSQFQAARARAIKKVPAPRVRAGGKRK